VGQSAVSEGTARNFLERLKALKNAINNGSPKDQPISNDHSVEAQTALPKNGEVT
jgi:hypothetical protein